MMMPSLSPTPSKIHVNKTRVWLDNAKRDHRSGETKGAKQARQGRRVWAYRGERLLVYTYVTLKKPNFVTFAAS
jgi:hypothetical protein